MEVSSVVVARPAWQPRPLRPPRPPAVTALAAVVVRASLTRYAMMFPTIPTAAWAVKPAGCRTADCVGDQSTYPALSVSCDREIYYEC